MKTNKIDLLLESKAQYTEHLCEILIKPIYESMHGDFLACGGKLQQFQKELEKVPVWNQDFIHEKVKSIPCDYLSDLVKAVFTIYVKVLLASTKPTASERDNVKLKIPTLDTFVHRCFVSSARSFWKRLFLFDNKLKIAEQQQNIAVCESLIRKAIQSAIRDSLPMQMLVQSIVVPKKSTNSTSSSSSSSNDSAESDPSDDEAEPDDEIEAAVSETPIETVSAAASEAVSETPMEASDTEEDIAREEPIDMKVEVEVEVEVEQNDALVLVVPEKETDTEVEVEERTVPTSPVVLDENKEEEIRKSVEILPKNQTPSLHGIIDVEKEKEHEQEDKEEDVENDDGETANTVDAVSKDVPYHQMLVNKSRIKQKSLAQLIRRKRDNAFF
jgi:hypothetical protein